MAESSGQEQKAGDTGSSLADGVTAHYAKRKSSHSACPSQCTLSIMAPRSRLKVLNSELAESLISHLPVHPTLSQLESPLEAWLASDLLVIEVPVLEFGKAAVHNALQRLTIRAKSQGPHVMLSLIHI